MKAKFIYLAIAVALFLAKYSRAQNDPSNNDSSEDSMLMEIPKLMIENHVPCVGVGLIKNGDIEWTKVFGEVGQNVKAPVNTLFNIASQTKPVVAMLVLKLVQSGNWNLDEPLAKYWIDPDIENDPNLNKLTTRLVLSHQSGFPNWRSNDESGKLKFNFEPGTKFSYSGEGFEYLRRALERKFKKPLNALMDSVLFQPLGMRDTRYWGEDLDTSRFAQWHDAQGKQYSASIQTSVNAADDLITTVEDYCKLGLFTMNTTSLSPTLFDEMTQPLTKVKDHYYRGLGWGLVKDLSNGEYVLEHGGSDLGVRTMALFLPKSKRGIVVMTNGDNGMFVYERIIRMAFPEGREILTIMNKAKSGHERIAISDTLIESYAGSYEQSNGKAMHISKEGNAIKVSGDGVPTAILFPESQTKFFLEGYDVQLEFPDNASLVVYEGGKQVMKIGKTKE